MTEERPKPKKEEVVPRPGRAREEEPRMEFESIPSQGEAGAYTPADSGISAFQEKPEPTPKKQEVTQKENGAAAGTGGTKEKEGLSWNPFHRQRPRPKRKWS